ncbi:hypothetical protein BGZ94_006225, partial [Podila epigama]
TTTLHAAAAVSQSPPSTTELNPVENSQQGRIGSTDATTMASILNKRKTMDGDAIGQDVTNKEQPTTASMESTMVPTTTTTTTSSTSTHTGALAAGASTANPTMPSALLYSAALVFEQRLVQSQKATMAFFYRTFSPTYRVTNMYIDSWSNGSQKRGLERIKKSVVRMDAWTLVTNMTVQVKDVWHQMLASRANMAKEKKRQLERDQAKKAATATATTDASKNHGSKK